MEPSPLETHVYFFPVRGQSLEQQDRDKYQCNAWAVQQSGFDPSLPSVPPHLHVAVSNAGRPPSSGVAAGAVTGAVLGASGRSASVTLWTLTDNPSPVRLYSRYRQFGVNHIGPITHQP